MMQRPNPSETEEDLLKLQDEFFSSRKPCSTKLHQSSDFKKQRERDKVKLG